MIESAPLAFKQILHMENTSLYQEDYQVNSLKNLNQLINMKKIFKHITIQQVKKRIRTPEVDIRYISKMMQIV